MGHTWRTSKTPPSSGEFVTSHKDFTFVCSAEQVLWLVWKVRLCLQGADTLAGNSRLMARTLPLHPNKRVFPNGSELEGAFRVIWSLVKPYLEAHDVKQTLPLKLGTLGP